MKCGNCGSRMKSNLENYRYTECGLDIVILERVEVRRCPDCAEYEVVIPLMEDLHRAIAMSLAWKTPKLSGAEIRFMRKYLGFSGSDFAKAAGTSAETVSRWENGKQVMGPQAERMLRLMVLTKEPVQAYPPDLIRLSQVAKGEPKVERVKFRYAKKQWQPEHAVA